jgi:hypothetical protein
MTKLLKEISKRDFMIQGEKPQHNEVILGALLRIADATELMAKNHLALQSLVDKLKRHNSDLLTEIDTLKRQIIIEKGLKTRYKNRLNNNDRS